VIPFYRRCQSQTPSSDAPSVPSGTVLRCTSVVSLRHHLVEDYKLFLLFSGTIWLKIISSINIQYIQTYMLLLRKNNIKIHHTFSSISYMHSLKSLSKKLPPFIKLPRCLTPFCNKCHVHKP